MRSFSLFALLAPTVVLTVACSSSPAPTSEFDTPDHGTSQLETPTQGTLGGEITPGDPNANKGIGDPNNGTCATTSAEAALTPVNLIVMYDQSGSMGDTNESASYDPAKRWIPVKTAMKAFFTDASSAGMRAQLTFFANAQNSCNANDYKTAEVALAALPNTALSTTIDAHAPKGDTPTKIAVEGAISQAQAVIATHPTEKTVIVLVTDGEPYGCGINNAQQSGAQITAVQADVAAVAATIPTYVIGVGPSVSNLDKIATSGGTTAFHVDVGDPSQTTTQLLAAMAAIRGQLGRCDFDIPTPPDGRALDFNKVNVAKQHAGQADETLAYNETCAGGTGWHFDNKAAPTKVLLCDSTCNAVKSDAGGKVNVSFSCVDRADVVH